jgi:hypothetical protein
MKQQLLLTVAVVALATTAGTHGANACDKQKESAARTASYTAAPACANGAKATAVTAANGTACSAASRRVRGAHGASATTASTASTASKTAAGDACCAAKSAKAAAATASAHAGCTADKGASAMAAGMIAMPAGGPSCNGHGMAQSTGSTAHADCDACADLSACEETLHEAGTQIQVVPLKNGVMFVYTTDTPAHVRSIQAALNHRTERLTELAVAGDKAKLCPECKNVRGAIASGKLTRETVNIEGGCLTLMTSNDPGGDEAALHGGADDGVGSQQELSTTFRNSRAGSISSRPFVLPPRTPVRPRLRLSRARD